MPLVTSIAIIDAWVAMKHATRTVDQVIAHVNLLGGCDMLKPRLLLVLLVRNLLP